MQVRLFGELEVVAVGVPVPVRGGKQRALLALLALRRGQPVSAERLIEALWSDGQAAHPANALQAQIGQLRRTLGPAAIITTEAGYALDVGPEDVDVVRFEHLVADGRRLAETDQFASASAALSEALRLRRGEPLAEFADASFADAERAHLDGLLLVAIETRAVADLALGRHGELAAELEAWCRRHPLRERLWELLILALYRAGRRPRPSAPTPRSVTAWSASSTSTPVRRCATSRPASWPSTPHSAPNQSHPCRWPPRRACRPARDEVLCPEVAAWSGAASAAERAAGPRDRVEVDARLRARWLRQDDAAHRVAGGGTGRAGR